MKNVNKKNLICLINTYLSDVLDFIVTNAQSGIELYDWIFEQTKLYYEAVAPTIDLVNIGWLNECIRQKMVLPAKGFLLTVERRRRVNKKEIVKSNLISYNNVLIVWVFQMAKYRFPPTTNTDFVIPSYICQRRFPIDSSRNSFLIVI